MYCSMLCSEKNLAADSLLTTMANVPFFFFIALYESMIQFRSFGDKSKSESMTSLAFTSSAYGKKSMKSK